MTDTVKAVLTTGAFPRSSTVPPQHAALMQNPGITPAQIAWLVDLGQLDFLHAAAPLTIVNGTEGSVKPLAIK